MRRRRAPEALRSRSFPSDRLAWLVFAAVILLATLGTRAWLHRRVRVEGAPAAAGAEFRLVVLAWDRVGGEGDVEGDVHVDARRLGEQLEALRAAGFTAVSLRQVHGAYARGAPLPARSVLLAFDGGHLSTYEAVDPLLRRLGWPAVMFVDPHLQERRDATYVYWDRLRRMVDSGLWDLGTFGDDPGGASVVARRLGGYEVLAAVARRRVVEGASGASGSPLPLGFESSHFGVNDPTSDARRLFRLRVPREWTGPQLAERLEYSLGAPAGDSCREPPPVPAARWVRAAGGLAADGDAVTLAGAPRGEAWVAGGEWARDFVLEAEVRAEQGPFWIVQQGVGSREQWRWGATDGALYLQRLRPGAPVEVVSKVERALDRGAWHTLRVVKRGGGLWVEWDGEPVAGMPRPVGAHGRGDVGLATGSPSGPGRVTLRRVRFAAVPYRVRPVGGTPGRAEVTNLIADAPCLAAISPPGLVEQGEALVPRRADQRLLSMLAARGAWDLVPAVEISPGSPAASAERAEEAAQLAAREGWAGVRLVARDGVPVAADTWRAALDAWALVFRRRALVVLDGGVER